MYIFIKLIDIHLIFNKARPELLVLNSLRIIDNQQNTVDHFHQDFVASTHSNVLQGHTDSGPFYLPNHSGEVQLSKQEKAVKSSLMHTLSLFILITLPRTCQISFRLGLLLGT
jgi:hypothetical protein